MLINDKAERKMMIVVDADKISDEAASKLNKILEHFEMVLTEDGWYTGTNDHCKSVQVFIAKDRSIFDNLKKWILWDPDTGSKEDCIEANLEFLRKWG